MKVKSAFAAAIQLQRRCCWLREYATHIITNGPENFSNIYNLIIVPFRKLSKVTSKATRYLLFIKQEHFKFQLLNLYPDIMVTRLYGKNIIIQYQMLINARKVFDQTCATSNLKGCYFFENNSFGIQLHFLNKT